jgi:UDP-2,3-diacylglucosamine pyrophosphatase LpxH
VSTPPFERSGSTRRAALAMLVFVTVGASGSGQQPPAPSRLLVVASDLHLGPGRDPQTGQWLAIEDFRWQDDFASFLRAVNEAGKGATDLVLNGDTFELWQSAATDCRQRVPELGCTEPESLQRVDRVLAAHGAEIAALAAFARSGTNRLVLVPGDHDAALLFPSVAARVTSALQAPGRIVVATRGFWRSADGVVYVEHGHQQPGDPYASAGWPSPLVQGSGGPFLERSPGEQLIQTYYNAFEPPYPILDNFAQDGAGLKYLAAADSAAVPPDRVGALLTFFLTRPTWQQFRQELDGGDVQPPEWDLAAVRSRGATLLVESLLPDDRFRPLAERAAAEKLITMETPPSDEALNALCDYRAALRRSRRRLERSMTQAATVGPVISECPRTASTRGSAFEYFWRSRDRTMTRHVEQVRVSVAGEPSARPVGVVVQGHTHLAASALPTARGEGAPVVLNSGAWQRTVTPFQIEETLRDRGWSEAQLLQKLRPEDLPACYAVVWIEPYLEQPSPRVRFWRADGRWGALPRDAAGMANACGGGGPAASKSPMANIVTE